MYIYVYTYIHTPLHPPTPTHKPTKIQCTIYSSAPWVYLLLLFSLSLTLTLTLTLIIFASLSASSDTDYYGNQATLDKIVSFLCHVPGNHPHPKKNNKGNNNKHI